MAKPRRQPTRFDDIDFPDYEFQEFPKMLYHPDGRQELAANAGEAATMLEELGFHDHPAKAAELRTVVQTQELEAARLAKQAETEAEFRAKVEKELRAKIEAEVRLEMEQRARIEAEVRAEMALAASQMGKGEGGAETVKSSKSLKI